VTVLPVATYAMSGLSTSAEEYGRFCRGARIGDGLFIRGEEVRDGGRSIDEWVRTHV
jgi:hypothetical protein